MLLVNENIVTILLSLYVHTNNVLMFLVQLLRPFLSNIVNVIEFNECVTGRLNTLSSNLQDMLLV